MTKKWIKIVRKYRHNCDIAGHEFIAMKKVECQEVRQKSACFEAFILFFI